MSYLLSYCIHAMITVNHNGFISCLMSLHNVSMQGVIDHLEGVTGYNFCHDPNYFRGGGGPDDKSRMTKWITLFQHSAMCLVGTELSFDRIQQFSGCGFFIELIFV